MQLPRGTFREIKKATLISSLLDGLEHEKFSGICSLSSQTVSGTLVFKSGKCILAKIEKKTGDEAWDELRNMSNLTAEAALTSLDEAQIQLALEFNKQSRVMKAGKYSPTATPLPQKNADTPPHKHTEKSKTVPGASPTLQPRSSFTASPTPVRTVTPPQPVVPGNQSEQPSDQLRTAPKPAAPAYPLPRVQKTPEQEPKKPAEPEDTTQDSSSFENDIDTFETLDLENVTDKIRNDCKTMIKQLQLEHLMER